MKSVLVIRLRSLGDTVLTTPSLFALRRFLPQARIDILLEDWVAPLLEGSRLVDRVIPIPRHGSSARARVARELHRARYNVVYNLHGGTTATFLTRASNAPHRVGFSHYQYARLHNHIAPPPQEIWSRATLHSVEQQLALIGWTGVPVTDRPLTQLAVSEKAARAITARLQVHKIDDQPLALIHPAAAFETKRWPAENFAAVIEEIAGRGLQPVAIVSPTETGVLHSVLEQTSARVIGFDNLSVPEITALAARAQLFVGNDSGIAHIAAAVNTPCVVIFGSSNVMHWRPWTSNHSEVVREELSCQPCHGYFCAEFEKPKCILTVPAERVVAAIDRVMKPKLS
ncbi:MAG TPA: glycosyltransferase family 9 protein [Pyrinomonadaceae bacterium]|nr:glycosyltransferase family 9 protein [Pyrinomonadaceae bacterium]